MASFEKIDYLLRPSKQVERKLIIETMQKLSKAGYYISEYKYFGFGSIYYADFQLFHKYLHINDMLCVEINKIEKRMKFNKPYDFIELEMNPASSVIPNLDRNKRHLVWLDYDFCIDEDILSDIKSCIHVLSPGSIFLVTITCDTTSLKKKINPSHAKMMKETDKLNWIANYLNELIGDHYGSPIIKNDLAINILPGVITKALRNFINYNVSVKSNQRFFQLFNFLYSDGMQMLTLGGIIDENNSAEKIDTSGIFELPFLTKGEDPIIISIPHLTVREKLWLDQNIKSIEESISKTSNLPPNMEFEIQIDMVSNYLKYYRQYPSYFETIG